MPLSRREFLRSAGAAAVAAPAIRVPSLRPLKAPVRLGLLADLHQDIMHDGEARLDAFLAWTERAEVDRVVQLGDFAYPSKAKNGAVIDKVREAKALHVIGNHDLDAGHTKEQCLDVWGMTGRFYREDVGGLRLLVLDGNDRGSPTHGGGYPSYVGKEQQEWLAGELAAHPGPFVVFSHQALAGPWAVDNSDEMRAILAPHRDEIALCVNGHNHIDLLQRIDGVHYLHVNSASYYWVGGAHQHESYAPEVHAEFPAIARTSPFRDALFAGLTFDPETGSITIEGRESEWVGPSPAALGADSNDDLVHGEQIAPRIRSRRIERARR